MLGTLTRRARAVARVSLSIFALALAVACQDAAPTAPLAARAPAASASLSAAGNGATHVVNTQVYDYEGSEISVECNGTYTEPIRLRGKVVAKDVVVHDGAGGTHSRIDWMSVGLGGTGTITGADYRMAEREFGVFHSNEMGAGAAYRVTFDVRAPSIDFRAKFRLSTHWTANANGELVLEREHLAARCTD